MIPNFFILGQPRSATTALASYLASHPNVYLSPIKEPCFFDRDMGGPKLSLRQYQGLFSRAKPDVHLAVGEASPTYLFSETAVRGILEFNPNARFVVILRNPVDFLQSLHAMKVYWGEENIRDFEGAWRAQAERQEGKRIPVTCRDPKWLFYSDWAMYGRQMERLFARVPRKSVKVFLFKDLVTDPRRVYEETLSFLEVPSDGRWKFPVVNEGRHTGIIWLQQLQSLVFNAALHLRKRLGLGMRNFGIAKKILSFNSRPAEKFSLSEDFKQELREYYAEDIRKLSGLIDRDLSFWMK